MSKHIGIVACSAEGAALCYRTICSEAPAILGEHRHPEITMHTYPLSDYMDAIYENNWDKVGQLMSASANILANAGAEFAICPDNTIHQAFGFATKYSSIPWLHIAKVVAENAVTKGFSHLGILGTRYLMEGPVYSQILEEFNIKHSIPSELAREKINQYIFKELVNAVFTNDTRQYFHHEIENLRDLGCDAVVLGCTEIPLLVDPNQSVLPVLDSTRLLASAALEKSLQTV
ncbi:amino acid racemase [candidate division KSB1 bacterium]|nr:amino acid racemase [candidate division KSB1 bacterium]